MARKTWNVGDRVKSNSNKYSGTVVEVRGNKVIVETDGNGKMQFGSQELKREH